MNNECHDFKQCCGCYFNKQSSFFGDKGNGINECVNSELKDDYLNYIGKTNMNGLYINESIIEEINRNTNIKSKSCRYYRNDIGTKLTELGL